MSDPTQGNERFRRVKPKPFISFREQNDRQAVDDLSRHSVDQLPDYGNKPIEQNNKEQRQSTTWIKDLYRVDKVNLESQKKAGHRVFRLKGYTTVGKINRKFKQERQQRLLRNALTTLMVIILLIILVAIYNPFRDMSEFKKISGEDSLYKNRTTVTTTTDASDSSSTTRSTPRTT